MLVKRKFFSLVVFNSTLFAIGGRNNEQPRIESVECYDAFDNTWKFVSSMNRARSSCSAIVCNNRLFVLGGRPYTGILEPSVEYYDILNNSWNLVRERNKLKTSLYYLIV